MPLVSENNRLKRTVEIAFLSPVEGSRNQIEGVAKAEQVLEYFRDIGIES